MDLFWGKTVSWMVCTSIRQYRISAYLSLWCQKPLMFISPVHNLISSTKFRFLVLAFFHHLVAGILLWRENFLSLATQWKSLFRETRINLWCFLFICQFSKQWDHSYNNFWRKYYYVLNDLNIFLCFNMLLCPYDIWCCSYCSFYGDKVPFSVAPHFLFAVNSCFISVFAFRSEQLFPLCLLHFLP